MAKGLTYQEKALEIYKNVLGDMCTETAISYNNVGVFCGKMGFKEKSLVYQEKALDIFKSLNE